MTFAKDSVSVQKERIVNLVYPIGSIYLYVSATSSASFALKYAVECSMI